MRRVGPPAAAPSAGGVASPSGNAPSGPTPFVTLADAPVVAWDVTGIASPVAHVAINGDRTLALLGHVSGQTGVLLVEQVAPGGHALTLPSGSRLPQGSALFLSTGAGKRDRLTYEDDGGPILRWTVTRDV